MAQAQEACGPLEIDNALTVVRGLEKDMQEAKVSAADGKLKPLPGETVRKDGQHTNTHMPSYTLKQVQRYHLLNRWPSVYFFHMHTNKLYSPSNQEKVLFKLKNKLKKSK